MSRTVTFTVPGKPRAKQRIKASIQGGKVHTRTPTATRNWESVCAMFARQAWGSQPPMEGPVKLTVQAIYARPGDLSRQKHPAGTIFCSRAVGDIDNVCKAVADGLNSSGVWHDDCQVVILAATKLYSAKGGAARVVVTVDEL